MRSARSYDIPGGRTWPVASALNVLVLVCALFTFLMARDGIDAGTGWVYLLCLASS